MSDEMKALLDIKTSEQARALPDIDMSEFRSYLNSGGKLRIQPPIMGDSIIAFIDEDGETKQPYLFNGKVYKAPIDMPLY